MNWEIIMAMTGVMLFAYWFNYIMGSPLSDEPKPREILFWVPYNLAVRRLIQSKQFGKIKAAQSAELEIVSDQRTRRQLVDDQRLAIFLEGRDLFTWEKSLLCPICFHFWLTIAVGVVFLLFDILNARADFWLAGFSYLSTHFLIRKIL